MRGWPKTSSVCSPSRGARVTGSTGVREKRTGKRAVLTRPTSGWSSVWNSPIARACSADTGNCCGCIRSAPGAGRTPGHLVVPAARKRPSIRTQEPRSPGRALNAPSHTGRPGRPPRRGRRSACRLRRCGRRRDHPPAIGPTPNRRRPVWHRRKQADRHMAPPRRIRPTRSTPTAGSVFRGWRSRCRAGAPPQAGGCAGRRQADTRPVKTS